MVFSRMRHLLAKPFPYARPSPTPSSPMTSSRVPAAPPPSAPTVARSGMLGMRPSSAATSWVACRWAWSHGRRRPQRRPVPAVLDFRLDGDKFEPRPSTPTSRSPTSSPRSPSPTTRGAGLSSTEQLSRLIPSVTPSPCSVLGHGAVRTWHGGLRRRRQGAPPRAPQPAPHQGSLSSPPHSVN